jgi:hypothetical protein
MKTQKENHEFLETIYKEAGINYRYFLDWRHKLMVRFFLFIAAVFIVFRWIYEEHISAGTAWMLPFLSLLITIAFWCMDHRSKTLFRASQKTGEAIENELAGKKSAGAYKAINHLTANNTIIASRVMGMVYAVASLCFFILTVAFLL